MAVLDEEKPTDEESIGDEHMRRITGIGRDEESAMEKRAQDQDEPDSDSVSPEALGSAEASARENDSSGASDAETQTEQDALTEHENQIGQGMREEKPGLLRRWGMRAAGMSGRKKALFGGGLFGILITFIFMAFLAFLPLKINHIVENLTNHFFASSQEAVGNRAEILFSDYLKKYVMPGMKTAVNCNSTKTITKDCVKIDGDDTPAKKLFHAWSDARLENTLADKYGFEVAYNPQGFNGSDGKSNYRITIDGNKFDLPDDWPTGSDGVFEAVGGRNDVRQIEKQAFANETLWKRVMYRFKVGRLLERKYNIRRCLFICKQTDGFADWKDAKTGKVKKDVARAILSTRVVSRETSALQLILSCMVSDACAGKAAPGADFDRRDKFEADLQDAMKELDQKLTKYTASDILKELEKYQQSGSFIRYLMDHFIEKFISNEFASKVASNLIPVFGQIDTVAQWIKKFQGATSDLKKWIFAAKATAMVSTFVLYRSYADEVKDGKVDSQLLGEMVKSLGDTAGGVDDNGVSHQGQPAESTPLYTELMGSKPSTAASILNVFSPSAYAQATTIQKSQYVCQDGKPVPAGRTVCDEDNLNSTGMIGDILDALKGEPFNTIEQAASIWNNNFIISGIHDIENGIGGIVGDVTDAIMKLPGISDIMSLVQQGLASTMNSFIEFIQQKILPTPLTDNPSGGSTFDAMAGGADISGNEYAQYGTGGGQISDQTAADIRTKQENEAHEAFISQPFFARMFDKDSPYSFVSQVAMAVPLNVTNFFQNSFASLISEPFTKIANAFGSLFSTRWSYAASAAPDPFGVPQIGYNPNDPSMNMNPDIFTDTYCTKMNNDWVDHDIHITNYNTGEYTLSDLKEDQNTGTDVHKTTNPCLLEAAATGSAGGLFSDDVLTKADLTDPGGSPAQGAGNGTLVSGDARALAAQIRANPNITYDYGRDGSIGSQVQAIADGQNPAVCQGRSMDPTILGIVLALAQNHQVNISSLIRPEDPCDKSPHANACAIDINHFDGQQLVGDDAKSIELVNDVINIVPTSQKLGFGVGNKGPNTANINFNGHNVELFSDDPSHVHVDTRCHV